MPQFNHLSDINPEILKLPQYLQDEFNKRFDREGTADYLILRAEDCINIIENEKWEEIKKKNENLRRKKMIEQNKPYLQKKTLEQNNPHLQKWQKLYKEEFNIDISQDLENLKIPEKQEGFNWLIIITKSLKLSTIYNKLKEKFSCDTWMDDIDRTKDIAQRPDANIYAIWVRDRIEADVELNNLSVNQMKKQDINPITLKERLLLELFYYQDTKEHLDLERWTSCAGSRSHSGHVPYVGCSRDRSGLYVDWCFISDASDGLRCRQVVSVKQFLFNLKSFFNF